MPLLIFDQFDDHQTRHLARFFPVRRHTWLPADKLTEVNAFWRDLKTLLDNAAIHCLFVTWADTADGLESIRFVPPQMYRLARLNADCVSLVSLPDDCRERARVFRIANDPFGGGTRPVMLS